MPNELFNVPAALRRLKRLDDAIAAHKQAIKKARADKTVINQMVAMAEKMAPSGITLIQGDMKPCPTCGKSFKSAGLGVHIRMKHQGGASKAHKASQAKKRAVRRG